MFATVSPSILSLVISTKWPVISWNCFRPERGRMIDDLSEPATCVIYDSDHQSLYYLGCPQNNSTWHSILLNLKLYNLSVIGNHLLMFIDPVSVDIVSLTTQAKCAFMKRRGCNHVYNCINCWEFPY